MNLKNSIWLKKFTASKIFLRFIGLLTFISGFFAVWFWQYQNKIAEVENKTEEIVFIVPVTSENLKQPEESEIQDRNLSEYAFGGRFTNLSEKTKFEMLHSAEAFDFARNFILKNWKEKKRAYIIYEFNGVDMGSDIYYFIEPDENRVWRVVERWKTSRLGIISVIHETNERIFYRLSKNRISKNTDESYLGSFYLRFFDKNGNEIETL